MNLRSRTGTRNFYKMILRIAVPMMIQNGLTNLVSLLDNLMIGRVGTNAISGVAIANQLIFVYYLVIFGATAGVGIFTAQFYGKGDDEGVRNSFRFKIVMNICIAVLSTVFFALLSPQLISLFLQGEGSAADAKQTLVIGSEYMHIILISLVPIAVINAYSGTLRDTGNTGVPMFASMIAITVNLIGNAILIYGLFGLPRLGANGAAIATVASRFVELSVLVIYTGTHSGRHRFIIGAWKHLTVPRDLAGKFILKSIPLMTNETLWSLSMTVINQCYSYRSLNAVAAVNIQSTIWNLIGVAFLAMGEAVGIIVGQELGAGDVGTAKDHAVKMRDFTVFCAVLCGGIMAAVSPFFPLLYNTNDEVRSLASAMILIGGLFMPSVAYMHASYFIIRAGGNTLITFLFDCCFSWLVEVPIAFFLSRYTSFSLPVMMVLIQSSDLIKCIIGGLMVRSGVWAKNIVK